MEQYQTDTHNQNQILVIVDLFVKLCRPHIHQIQQIIINNLNRQVIILQRRQRNTRRLWYDDISDIRVQIIQEALHSMLQRVLGDRATL